MGTWRLRNWFQSSLRIGPGRGSRALRKDEIHAFKSYHTRHCRGSDDGRPFLPSGARHRRRLRGLFTRFRPGADSRKVEFASNWYVRGDLAYAQETYPEIAPDSTFVSSPSVLNTYSVGAGFGYKINNWFRTDLILDYRSKVQAAGIGPSAQCITAVDASGNVTATDICTNHLDTVNSQLGFVGQWLCRSRHMGWLHALYWSRSRRDLVPALAIRHLDDEQRFALPGQ
jgi:hypothetical protein